MNRPLMGWGISINGLQNLTHLIGLRPALPKLAPSSYKAQVGWAPGADPR